MPERFTCRLAVIKEGDRFRIRYAPLGADYVACVICVQGPWLLMPPDGLLTPAEVQAWRSRLHESGFRHFAAHGRADVPLVVAELTAEDAIPKGAASASLFWADTPQGRTLGVEVVNSWNRDIPCLTLAACYEYAAPQPVELPPSRQGTDPVTIEEARGADEAFRQVVGEGDGRLWPGARARFLLNPAALPSLLSRAASCSVESHWLSLRTDGHEFDRVGGDAVAAFLDTHGADEGG